VLVVSSVKTTIVQQLAAPSIPAGARVSPGCILLDHGWKLMSSNVFILSGKCCSPLLKDRLKDLSGSDVKGGTQWGM